MSKHSPGPWKWVNRSGWYVLQAANGATVADDGSACVEYPRTIDPDDEGESGANARLIAAAPELLEALTTGAQMNLPDFLEWIAARLVKVHGEDPNVDYVQTLRHRAKLCREAIAKATGDGS